MYTKKDRIILSGDKGFLGSILSEKLKAMGYNVTGLAVGSKRERVDISNPFDLERDQAAHIVIHAAGKAHSVPKNEEAKQEFYNVNFEGTKNLCYALERLGQLPRSFIFVSSVAVYGIDQGRNINEDHPLNGHIPYAESKIMAERWLEDWAVELGVVLGILRLPLVVGPNPPGNLDAMLKGIRSGKYLSIGNADARKSMVWAEDIARIIPVLAEKGGTYNLTDGVHPTFRELETAIASALDKRKPISVPYGVAKGLAVVGDMLGSRFPINSNKLRKITSTLTFDDSQARNKLGWVPTPVLNKISELTGDS